MMTRQDFEKFAIVIRDQVNSVPDGLSPFERHLIAATLIEIASDLADVMEGSNSLFDRSRFLKACGVPE